MHALRKALTASTAALLAVVGSVALAGTADATAGCRVDYAVAAQWPDPWDFTGTESGAVTQWGPAATDPSRRATWGDQAYMEGQLKKVHDTFVVQGYPVLVGEYGSIDKTVHDPASNRYRADYARAMVTLARTYGAATAYWDNGYNGQYGFALFDRQSATVTQQGIIDAITTGTP